MTYAKMLVSAVVITKAHVWGFCAQWFMPQCSKIVNTTIAAITACHAEGKLN